MSVRHDVHTGETPPGDGALREAPRLDPLVPGRDPGRLGAGGVSGLYQAPARTISVPGEWASKGNTYRIRGDGKGFYRAADTVAWERAVTAAAQEFTPLEGPVAGLALVRSATTRKDSHNIQKALLDACESRRRYGKTKVILVETHFGLYHNDRQVGPFLVVPLPRGPAFTRFAVWPFDGDMGTLLSHWATWLTLQEEYTAWRAPSDAPPPVRPSRRGGSRSTAP